ncbi:MAG: flagellar motor protein MotB, partial [Pseudomonadota bacterium]
MAKKKQQGGGGAPDWLVTFADLMSLLVCFFVLIISFSIQDKEKLQVVAGSMREAFGVKETSRRTGIIEVEGIPIREYMKDISQVEQENDSDFSQERHEKRRKQGPEANTHDTLEADIEKPRQFATAAASLRQAWQEMPEITEVSSNIIL